MPQCPIAGDANASKHAALDAQLKLPATVPPAPHRYRNVLSHFAFELVLKEFRKAPHVQLADDNPDPCASSACSCSFPASYQLPCCHFFSYCLKHDTDLYNANLIHARWAPLPTSSVTASNLATSVNIMPVHSSANTHHQRFKLAMSRCTVIASVPADLAGDEFQHALHWLDCIELQAKQHSWDVASSTVTGDSVDAAQPSTSLLQFPTCVSQRGRPQKRKQQLLDKANQLTRFELKRPAERDRIRLTWLVSQEVATKALTANYLVTSHDIVVSEMSVSLCADERSKVNELCQYMTPEAYNMMQAKIQEFDTGSTKCTECNRTSGEGKRNCV